MYMLPSRQVQEAALLSLGLLRYTQDILILCAKQADACGHCRLETGTPITYTPLHLAYQLYMLLHQVSTSGKRTCKLACDSPRHPQA